MRKLHFFVIALAVLTLAGCSDKGSDPAAWKVTFADPNKEVQFSDFEPKEGVVRTSVFIHGSNFGTDESKILVTFNGRNAPVIASDGTTIHCMAPTGMAEKNEVRVKVLSEEGEELGDYVFDDFFIRGAVPQVHTLLRVVNEETGEKPDSPGPFDGGGSCPCSEFYLFDPVLREQGEKVFYTITRYKGTYQRSLRAVNLTKREITNVVDFSRIQDTFQVGFTPGGDTLLIAAQTGDNLTIGATDKADMYYALRSENFSKYYEYNMGCIMYYFCMMPDGTIFYSTYTDGSIIRMNKPGTTLPYRDSDPTVCFNMQNVSGLSSARARLYPHPTGKYVYMILDTGYAWLGRSGCLYRCDYDPVNKMLKSPIVIAGSKDAYSFRPVDLAEGIGTNAKFCNLYDACFMKNPEYVGREDEYDFMMTDRFGQCIWRVTPEGECRVYAGRSNNTGSENYGDYTGLIDGPLLDAARMEEPMAIAWDEKEDVLYFSANYAIRYISIE